jgi:hypothetical protein
MRRNEMEFKERKRWLFFGLPFTFTVYTVKEDVITVNTGFFNREENDCYMYKVQDVTLKSSLIERMFGLGSRVPYRGCHESAVGDTAYQKCEGCEAVYLRAV